MCVREFTIGFVSLDSNPPSTNHPFNPIRQTNHSPLKPGAALGPLSALPGGLRAKTLTSSGVPLFRSPK